MEGCQAMSPKNNLNFQRRRASSLIEMLIVIGVISLMATMLLPSLKRSLTIARTTLCKQNLRSTGQSLTMYTIENKGWLPVMPTVDEVSATSSRHANSSEVWFLKLFPTYMQDPAALTCPEDPFRYRIKRSGLDHHDPAVSDFSSFGINSFIMQAAGGKLARVEQYRPSRPLDTILVADMGPDVPSSRPAQSSSPSPIAGVPSSRGVFGPNRNNGLMPWDDGYNPYRGGSTTPWVTTRHDNGINMLTLGGGVREARTERVVRAPIRWRYETCSNGGCTLCNLGYQNRVYHYSFAKDQLYWWSGALNIE